MKFNRRNVLAGLGTAVAGTAAAFGTSAAVQEQVSREFTVTITNDNDGAVQLPITPTSTDGGRVSLDTNNAGVDVMTVDATNLPTDSNVTIGNFSNVDDSSTMVNGAFTVENQNAFGSKVELKISLESAASSDVELAVDDGSVTTVPEGESTTTTTLATGDTVDLGVWISTASTTETATIDITIEATEVSA